MLVLTRRPGEAIIFKSPDSNGEDGDVTELVVLGVNGNQVRFGVCAPKHIEIDRKEIRDRKDRGKKWTKDEEL